MKQIVLALLLLTAAPLFAANCSLLNGASARLYTDPNTDGFDDITFGIVDAGGRFVGTSRSGAATTQIVDGIIKATGSDTCSIEFTLKAGLSPRFSGVARFGGGKHLFLITGSYAVPALGTAASRIGRDGRPVEAAPPVAHPFYIRGIARAF